MSLSNTIKYILCLSIFFQISCGKKIVKDEIKKNKGNTIVLIFKEMPENWKLNIKGRGYVHNGKYEISYFKNDLIPVTWIPNKSKVNDTLKIKNVYSPIEVIHKYKGLDQFSYLLKPNDTIIFEYNEQMPNAKVINKNVRKYDLNFDALKRKIVVKEDFPAFLKYNSDIFYLLENQSKNEYLKKYKIKAKNELIKERKLLDSLLTASLISKDVYDFYSKRNFYYSKIINLKENKNLKYKIKINENVSFLNFSFYRRFLDTMIYERFDKNVEIIKTPISQIPDYRKIYDSINNCKIFNKKMKKYLSFNCLENIIVNFSNSDINKFLNKFNQTYNDSVLNNYFLLKYNLSNKISNDLQLKDFKNKNINFQEVLRENLGNVIYIDFWASWCPPCRKSFPSSIKMKEEFKDKKVVFIYLAINDKYKNWLNAMKEMGIYGYKYSFIIENSKNSKMIDDLGLRTIPRYLLYNRQGELVNQNAPNPDGKEIKNLINKHIH